MGSEFVRQPEGEVAHKSKSSQSSQPHPNPDHDRTVKPVVCRDENHEHPTVVCSEQTSHPREGQNLILEEETNHDRTETRCLPSGRSIQKHVSLMTARTSMWKMKQNPVERRNPLFAVMQITSAQF